jgi:hypothetical protein
VRPPLPENFIWLCLFAGICGGLITMVLCAQRTPSDHEEDET